MTHGSLFSGIGGAEYAAQKAGWENVFHCEINPFGRKILDHYWPKAKSYADIKQTDFTIWRNRIDVLTGGFPCQPFSTAGKRKGTEDDRHLWPEMLRAIQEIQPRYIVGENVRGFTNWGGGLVFDQVLSDLENEGYQVAPFLLPACGVNAPHRRDRIWIVAQNTYKNGWGGHIGKEESSIRKFGDASSRNNERLPPNNGETGTITNPSSDRRERIRQGIENENGKPGSEQSGIMEGRFEGLCSDGDASDAASKRLEGCSWGRQEYAIDLGYSQRGYWQDFPTQSPVCSGNDGFSTKLDGITFSKWRNESIKAFGNAWVPQVAYQIFKVINQMELCN